MKINRVSQRRWFSVGTVSLLISGLAVGGFALPATAVSLDAGFEMIDVEDQTIPVSGKSIESEVVPEVVEGGASRVDDNEVVNIPDPVLRDIIAKRVNAGDPDAITVGEMQSLYSLDIWGWYDKVTDLTGLEYASNLQVMDIREHDVRTFEPLRNLPRLTQIKASNNPQLSDISALSTIPEMRWLELNFTSIDSLEGLRGNTALTWLQIAGTKVTSLEPLSNVTTLWDINFQDTAISDLEPLRGLTELGTIGALRAKIESIEPLTGMQEMTLLNINRNKVRDLSPIETMPLLRQVGFEAQVVDGPAVQVPAGADAYTKIDIADSFAMAYDQRQQVTDLVDEITPDGEGGIWRGLDDSTESVQAFVSKPIVPGGPRFSATITYPIERAVFTSDAPTQPRLETEYSFAFTTTPGFIDYSALGTDANRFTLLSGEIPGLTLGADGVLAGTPTELGSFEITVRATDKHGNIIDQTYTIVVGEKIIDVDPPIVDPVDPPVDPPVKPVPPVKPAPDLAETGSTLAPFLASVAGLALLTGVVALLLGRRTKRN